MISYENDKWMINDMIDKIIMFALFCDFSFIIKYTHKKVLESAANILIWSNSSMARHCSYVWCVGSLALIRHYLWTRFGCIVVCFSRNWGILPKTWLAHYFSILSCFLYSVNADFSGGCNSFLVILWHCGDVESLWNQFIFK